MYRWSAIFGWVAIAFLLMLVVAIQFFGNATLTVLCHGSATCDMGAVIIYQLCFYGILLSLFIVLANRLKLLVCSVLIAVALAEAGYRVQDSFLNSQFPQNEEEAASPIPMYDAVLGWRMTPSLETFFTNKANRIRTKVQINSKGLRDDEYEYRKPREVTRILLLGDSVVAGMEVSANEVLDKRLELLLGHHGKYEVINAGVRGYGTDQSLLFFQNEGYKYTPDIVIYIFVNNDPIENVTIHKPYRKFGKAYFARVGDDLALKGVPVPRDFSRKDEWIMSDPSVEKAYNHAARKSTPSASFTSTIRGEVSRFHFIDQILNSLEYGTIRAWLESFGFVDRLYGMGGIWPYQEPKPRFVEDYEWDITERLVSKMNRFSVSLNARFVIYESSSSGSHNTGGTRLESIARNMSVPYFNSFEQMYEASNGTRLFSFPLDVHWNAKGHDFVAQAIYQFLIQNGFLKDGSSPMLMRHASFRTICCVG